MRLLLIIRRIHLWSSLLLMAFLLMYIFTGIIQINRTLFEMPENETTWKTIPVPLEVNTDQKEYAYLLKEELELKGRVNINQDWKKRWVFNYEFPGEGYQITLTESRDSLIVKQMVQKRTFFTLIHQMHVLRGFKGGWPYTLWAVFYDLSAVAMIVFALTGIVIWWKSRKLYKHGIYYLTAGIAIPLIILLLFIFWR